MNIMRIMDFRGDAKMAQFGFMLGWEASAASATVGWQRGDEFEALRRQSQPGSAVRQ